MNIFRIIVSIGCVFFILITLMRMIWLFKPALFSGTFLARFRQVARSQMIIYYFAGMIASLYYIFFSLDKLNLI